jgi:hypothetical protein
MGLLSASARAARPYASITLRDFQKSLPNAASVRGIESDIDPRLILGLGAASTAPTGYATANALQQWQPHEMQAHREASFERRARLQTEALRARMMGITSRDVADPELAAELQALEQSGPPAHLGEY